VIIISDTHGEVHEQIINLIIGADLCVHAGDLGGAEVIRQIKATDTPLVAVRGNNDNESKWPVDDHQLLNKLPLHQVIELPGGTLCVEHGHAIVPVSKRHDKLRLRYPDAKAIVYGHSHRAVKDQDVIPWVLNPGAAGSVRTFGGASCMVLTIATNRRWNVKMVKNDIFK